MDEVFLRPEEASRLLNVTKTTLIQWDKDGKIKTTRTKGGHRRYLKSSLPLISSDEKPKRKICYCRVSTHGQKNDLETQVNFFKSRYPDHEIIKDLGSGINFKRKGFIAILDAAVQGDISEVVVTHKDRLCRFGFELIERIISIHSKGKIVVLNKKETSPEKELVDDLLSIVTVFSSRLYGLRSHSIKKKIKDQAYKNPETPSFSNKGRESKTTDTIPTV
jgi:excisionase family DNA binding protein